MKNTQSGRSMVEMLGVLAIIGMLSVGGIWGFSEAMERYKLNKSKAQISAIFQSISAHIYDYPTTADTNHSVVPYFKYKTPALFDDMKVNEYPKMRDPYNYMLQDAMGSEIMIYINGAAPETVVLILSTRAVMSLDPGVAYCRNVLSAVQPVYRENPKKFSYIRIQSDNGSVFTNDDFANMSVGQMTTFCYDALATVKEKLLFFIVFRNRK